MTGEQSRTLSVADRVYWAEDRNDQGAVTEKNWAGVTKITAGSPRANATSTAPN